MTQVWDDAARVVRTLDDDGNEVEVRAYNASENENADRLAAIATAEANRTTLRQQAVGALQTNRDFLALAAPTNAQTLAQVKALTQQNIRIIRLVAEQLDGIN